eukprot:3793464-Prymnesium_polylepis.1
MCIRDRLKKLVVQSELEAEKQVNQMLWKAAETMEANNVLANNPLGLEAPKLDAGAMSGEEQEKEAREKLVEGLIALLPQLRLMVERLKDQQGNAVSQLERESHAVAVFHGLTQAQKLQVLQLQLLAVEPNDNEPLSAEWASMLAAKLGRLLGDASMPPARAADVLTRLIRSGSADVQLQ